MDSTPHEEITNVTPRVDFHSTDLCRIQFSNPSFVMILKFRCQRTKVSSRILAAPLWTTSFPHPSQDPFQTLYLHLSGSVSSNISSSLLNPLYVPFFLLHQIPMDIDCNKLAFLFTNQLFHTCYTSNITFPKSSFRHDFVLQISADGAAVVNWRMGCDRSTSWRRWSRSNLPSIKQIFQIESW